MNLCERWNLTSSFQNTVWLSVTFWGYMSHAQIHYHSRFYKSQGNSIQRKLGDKKKDTEIDPDVHAPLQAEPEIAEDDPFDDEADKNNPNLVPTVKTVVDPVTYTPDTYDEYIAASILLQQGGEQKMAKVLRCNTSGLPIGTRNANPILDTR
jgi:hypothetical protein